MDAGSFSLGQDARSKSPAPTHELAGHRPASAKRGGLLFGYFLLATQEKVARAPQGVRKLLPWLFKSKSIAAEAAPTKSKSIAHDRRKSLVDRVRSYKKEQKHHG